MKILFLCTGNSCRSQMAEGYARHLGSDYFEVNSAGIEAHGLNPRAVQIMREDGIDISQQQSKKLTADMLQWADLVVTVCGHADANCPLLPKGVERKCWLFEDPAKAQGTETEIMDKFRTVRDEIKSKIENLVAELKPTPQRRLSQ